MPNKHPTPARAFFGAALVNLALALAHPAQAQELSFGLITDLERGGPGAVVEFHGKPIFTNAYGLSGRWGAAGRIEQSGNAWAGAGFVLSAPLGDKAFVEASFMPGHYWPGDTDLGHAMEFRSLIGIGWSPSQGHAWILSLDHISNANIAVRNPGAETVALRYRMAF